jgi:co-chaperonin GroES (HSP10)
MTLGGGDALARGARSAQFSTGGASLDDEVIINPSIVAPEEPTLQVIDRRRYLDGVLPQDEVVEPEKLEFPESQFDTFSPILDRVLVMRVSTDKDIEILSDGSARNKRTGVIIPGQYRQHSNTGIVLAAGDAVIRGTTLSPMELFVRIGDRVTYGDYNSELFPMEEEKIKEICRAHKVNYEHHDEGLRVVRVQDIRGVEKRKVTNE